jgi:hypothetical protein
MHLMSLKKIKFEMQTRFYSTTDWDFHFVDADGFVTFMEVFPLAILKLEPTY